MSAVTDIWRRLTLRPVKPAPCDPDDAVRKAQLLQLIEHLESRDDRIAVPVRVNGHE